MNALKMVQSKLIISISKYSERVVLASCYGLIIWQISNCYRIYVSKPTQSFTEFKAIETPYISITVCEFVMPNMSDLYNKYMVAQFETTIQVVFDDNIVTINVNDVDFPYTSQSTKGEGMMERKTLY